MKKNSLYIAGICAALSVGALGCASSAKAGDEETKPVVEDTEAAGELRLQRKLFVFMVRFRRLPAIPSRSTISRESAVPARW